MTERFRRRLCDCDGFDTVLQVGTHVRVETRGVRHFCLTDMTLMQAAKADQFTATHLNDRQLSEAIAMQKQIFDSCEGIFVDSEWAKGSIVNDYGIASEKVCVSGVGASIRPNSNEHIREKFNILFVGRDWKRKGGDILVKAFGEVRKHIKDATLTIIGCAPAVSDPNIKVLGRLNKESVSDYRAIRQAFCRASVFCVPSLFEPFGICFLESQLYGVPVVTFRGQGRADAVTDGVTGMLIKDRSPEALSHALIKLLVDTELARQMGSAGRDFVMNNYTWDHVAKRILNRIENREGS
jgi:glycosyltransferase involved in cell wall biosynthesis